MYLVSNNILDLKGFGFFLSHYSYSAKYGKQKSLLEPKNIRRTTGILAEMVESTVCTTLCIKLDYQCYFLLYSTKLCIL